MLKFPPFEEGIIWTTFVLRFFRGLITISRNVMRFPCWSNGMKFIIFIVMVIARTTNSVPGYILPVIYYECA